MFVGRERDKDQDQDQGVSVRIPGPRLEGGFSDGYDGSLVPEAVFCRRGYRHCRVSTQTTGEVLSQLSAWLSTRCAAPDFSPHGSHQLLKSGVTTPTFLFTEANSKILTALFKH